MLLLANLALVRYSFSSGAPAYVDVKINFGGLPALQSVKA
jgi:hypothetical protein